MDLELTCRLCEKKIGHTCVTKSLEQAVMRFLKWAPEGGLPTPMRRNNDMYSKGDEDAPFYSEAFLYPLFGKDDARSLLALIEQMITAMGVDFRSLASKAWEQMNAEAEAKHKAEQAQLEHRKNFAKSMRPMSSKKVGAFRRCKYRTFYAFDRAARTCEKHECTKGMTVPEKKQGLAGCVLAQDGLYATCKLCKKVHFAPRQQIIDRVNEERYQSKDPEYSRLRTLKARELVEAAKI